MSEAVETDVVRPVDREHGHAARARRQAERAADPRVIEAADGSVHRTTSTTLVIPEEKRCTAMTVRGSRCKVGRMRGLQVCVFHSHLALADDALATLADGQKPRLSPREALKAVVQLRADELAQAAVSGALDAADQNRTRAVLALVDAVDPLVTIEGGLTLTAEGMQTASYRQLAQVFGAETSAA
jgi:hypothetical protein